MTNCNGIEELKDRKLDFNTEQIIPLQLMNNISVFLSKLGTSVNELFLMSLSYNTECMQS